MVRSTKPLFTSRTTVTGLEIRFEGGRAVKVNAEQGAEVMRGMIAADEGAARLGEVALVDREGRIGPLGTVFFDTLLDENAASHVALGHGYIAGVGDEADVARTNTSVIHTDFMIGSNDVAVTGFQSDGNAVPLLRDGTWQI
jgi:aminopeptidase